MADRTTAPDARTSAASMAPPDHAARDVITRELDKNILVEAAAGTGKTTSLVARMINLIKDGKCKVETLAAVTFTRKSAAELRARFQVGLEQSADETSGPEKERLAQAIEHVERAFLGTIHSFCARLLRERPVEAGVDAHFTELDDALDHEIRKKAWLEHVDRLLASDDPLVVTLEDLGVDLGKLSETFERFADYPDVEEWPAEKVAIPDSEPVLTALRSFVGHINALESSLPRDAGNDKLIPAYRRLARAVRQAEFRRPAGLLAVLAPFLNAIPTVVQKNWPGGKAQAVAETEAWTRFGQFYATPYVQALRRVRYDFILQAVRPAVEIYDRLRRDAGGLNFQDLLLIAAKMLRDSDATRRYFRKRFTHLLVDEFQDTDPIQAEVMMLLAATDPAETNWRRSRPVPGSLFVVGDPKQSIYRFRRADIVTYSEVKRIILQSGGLSVSLTANFRATSPLVQWVNESFTRRFPSDATEFAPAYSPLQVGRVDERAGELTGLYLLKSPGKNKEEILANESVALARSVRHALDLAIKVPRSHRERDQPDAAQPGDFLIVTRNTTNLSRYARELEALGVPHQVTGGTTLNELEELALLCICLRALLRPDDPVALVAAMRSELFGISDNALYEFKRSGGRFSFRRPVFPASLAGQTNHPIVHSLDRLNRYSSWLALLPPAAGVEKIADDLGLTARAASASGGNVRAGSLAKVFELVRIAAREQNSMLDLLEFLEGLIVADEKYDGIPVRPHAAPVVRLMNLHKVKGLEAPVVFLCDPTGQFEHPIQLHIDRSGAKTRGYMAVYAPRPQQGYAKPDLIASPTDWPRLEEIETDFLSAENERLLYVAATRAGTCLVVSHRDVKAKESPWHSLSQDLLEQPIHQDPGAQALPDRPKISVNLADVQSARIEINGRWSTLLDKTFDTKGIKEFALSGESRHTDSESQQLATLDLEARTKLAQCEQEGETGAEWGEDVHSLLEAAMRGGDAGLESLARSLTRDREHVDDEDARVKELLDCVRSVQRSEIWKRARKSQRILPEVPLMMMAPGTDTPLVLRGVIDLAFLETKGWVIVDYKTDQVKEKTLENLVEHYRPQVESYAKAWATLLRQPVHEVGLFFTRPKEYKVVKGPGA